MQGSAKYLKKKYFNKIHQYTRWPYRFIENELKNKMCIDKGVSSGGIICLSFHKPKKIKKISKSSKLISLRHCFISVTHALYNLLNLKILNPMHKYCTLF